MPQVNFKTHIEFGNNLETEVEVEVEASIVSATPNYFDRRQEQWYPGDQAELEEIFVYLDGEDITKQVDQGTLERLKEQAMEQ